MRAVFFLSVFFINPLFAEQAPSNADPQQQEAQPKEFEWQNGKIVEKKPELDPISEHQ